MKGTATPSEVFTSVKSMVDTVLQQARNEEKASCPICLVVDVEIHKDHLEEFINVITIDAEGSRTEPGCYRFDVLRDPENPCKFTFYETYKDQAAIEFHRNAPHFQVWTKFKEEGKVVSAAKRELLGMNFTF